MRKLAKNLTLFALAALSVLALAPCALAAPGDIGNLSSRFSMLDDLASSRNADENVVVETHIAVLTGANQALDNSSVRIEGEVVGEPVNAGTGLKWVSVNDDSGQGIAVLMTDEQLRAVESYGSYHQTGTTVEVTGIYHVACPDHQGELDVHATSVELVKTGTRIEHSIDDNMFTAAVVLIIIGFSLIACYLLMDRVSEKKGER